MPYRPLSVVVFLKLLMVSTAAGSEPATSRPRLTEQDFLQTLPVVIAPTQMQQPLSEAPTTVTTIDRSAIEALGVRQLPELFRRVIGIIIGYENISNPNVAYHGLNDGFSRHLQVLIDGRSVYNLFYGGVVWGSLPLQVEDIERIEFVHGPNASTDGANAFLGTLSITTRHASLERGQRVITRIGNNGIRDVQARFGRGRDGLDYRIAAAYQTDNGLDTRQDDRTVRYLSGRLDWVPTQTLQLTAQAGLTDNDFEQGFETEQFSLLTQPFEACFPVHNRPIRDYYAQLRLAHVPNPAEQTTLNLYYSRLRTDFDFRRPPLCGGFVEDDDYTIERYNAELRDIVRLSPEVRMIWGAETRYDRVEAVERSGALTFRNGRENFSARLLGHLEWRFVQSWMLNTGAMVEHNSLIDEVNISPRLTINHALTPRQTLRAGVAMGIRTPAFIEENWQSDFYRTSGGLTPETIVSTEIGYVGHFPDRRLSVDARAFIDRVDDLITADPRTFPFDSVNAGRANIRGIEARLRWRPIRASDIQLAYTHIDLSSNDPFGVNYSDSSPDHIASVFVTHAFTPAVQGTAAYYYAARMEWLNDGTPVPATHLLDLGLSWRPPTWQGSRIGLRAKNVLDDAVTYKETNDTGRQFFIELDIAF